jgi:hypothetical protein
LWQAAKAEEKKAAAPSLNSKIIPFPGGGSVKFTIEIPRKGKPPRSYLVDLPAIRDRGEVATNYQLFPRDRLVVGSPAGVRRQAQLDLGPPPTGPRGALSVSRILGTASPTGICPTPARAATNEGLLHSGSG